MLADVLADVERREERVGVHLRKQWSQSDAVGRLREHVHRPIRKKKQM